MGSIANPPETATFNPVADWELIFECDETGLIALVSSAQTLSGISESTRLIIRSLFLRAKDAPIRAAYARGKDIELPLLAVSFRSPELFITERQALREMMKGCDAAEVRESYPLLARYLSDSF